MGDWLGPWKETTDGLHVTQGGGGIEEPVPQGTAVAAGHFGVGGF